MGTNLVPTVQPEKQTLAVLMCVPLHATPGDRATAVPGFLKLRHSTVPGSRLMCGVFVGRVSGLRMAKRVYCVGQMEQIVHTEDVRRDRRKMVKKL